jgi:hypothetical protein
MAFETAYRDAYPRAGQVALLCEGDLVGYEATLLRRWTDERLGTNPLVDIWPCGTSGAIYGMSDAVGRACPILVIEDRDFRTLVEAATDCQSLLRDRERRDVRLLGWRAWRRSEIENYLLERDVLVPVMVDAFGCAPQDVDDSLTEIVPTLTVFQAAQYCIHRARRSWNKSDPSRMLSGNANSRPTWSDVTCKLTSPDRDLVRTRLKENVERWYTSFRSRTSPDDVDNPIAVFDAKCEDWKNVLDSGTWLADWAGKDVLQWLRIRMSAQFGLLNPASGQRVKMTWEHLNREKREAQDRTVEAALRPLLVRQFLKHLATLREGDLYDEWAEIEKTLRA